MPISMTEDRAEGLRVPAAAAWLGGLGLVPFVGLSLACGLADGPLKATAAQGLLGYGAVILSFLGGIHWGAAMARSAARTDVEIDAMRLAISVLPSLAGWAALWLEVRHGLALLAVTFILVLVLDVRWSRQDLAPPWYPKLRMPLTTIVVAALILALIEF